MMVKVIKAKGCKGKTMSTMGAIRPSNMLSIKLKEYDAHGDGLTDL